MTIAQVWAEGGVGVLRISSDGDARMGATIKTQKNPWGNQAPPLQKKKIPGTSNKTPKKSMDKN